MLPNSPVFNNHLAIIHNSKNKKYHDFILVHANVLKDVLTFQNFLGFDILVDFCFESEIYLGTYLVPVLDKYWVIKFTLKHFCRWLRKRWLFFGQRQKGGNSEHRGWTHHFDL